MNETKTEANIEKVKKDKQRFESAINELRETLVDAGLLQKGDPSATHLDNHLKSIERTVTDRFKNKAYEALG